MNNRITTSIKWIRSYLSDTYGTLTLLTTIFLAIYFCAPYLAWVGQVTPSDRLKYLSTIIQSSAWPAVAVFIALLFKSDISAKIRSITKANVGNNSVDFTHDMKELSAEVSETRDDIIGNNTALAAVAATQQVNSAHVKVVKEHKKSKRSVIQTGAHIMIRKLTYPSTHPSRGMDVWRLRFRRLKTGDSSVMMAHNKKVIAYMSRVAMDEIDTLTAEQMGMLFRYDRQIIDRYIDATRKAQAMDREEISDDAVLDFSQSTDALLTIVNEIRNKKQPEQG